MPDLIDPAYAASLLQLAARYWARADGDITESIADQFTVDAELVLGSLVLTGRPAIENFFIARDATHRETQRTTRHIACNYRFNLRAADVVQVRSNVVVFAGVGSLPLPTAAPAGIADFDDLCVRSASGAWRYQRRTAHTIFVGATAAAFVR